MTHIYNCCKHTNASCALPSLPLPAQAAVAKCTLQCLCQVLAALDPANWPAAMAPFSMALSFVTDNRPKVRGQGNAGWRLQ